MRAVALVVGLALVSIPSAVHAGSTLGRTIVDRNGDNLLEAGPPEGYRARTELVGGVVSQRIAPPTLVRFAQRTDTRLGEEESPVRVEFVDRLGEPFIAAYRAQEGLLPF